MSTAAADIPKSSNAARTDWRVIGFALIVLAVVLAVFKNNLPEWLLRPTDQILLPFANWINAIFNFVKDDLGFIHVTRAFAGGVEALLDVTANLMYGKNRWPKVGPIPCLLYTSPSPRDLSTSRMPSSA